MPTRLDFESTIQNESLDDHISVPRNHEGGASGHGNRRRCRQPPPELRVENRELRAQDDLRPKRCLHTYPILEEEDNETYFLDNAQTTALCSA